MTTVADRDRAGDSSALLADWSVSETGGMLTDLIQGHTPDASSSWLEAREALIAHVSGEYLDVSPSVVMFLRRNSDLAWELIGAKSAVVRAFGPTVRIRLALVADVDIDESRQQQLFGYVIAALPLEEASAALDRFDQEWLLDRSANFSGRLAFDLEF